MYRLPMALRFWNGSALGMGDVMVGCVVLSFGIRRYGSKAGLLLAPAYTVGLFMAIYWSSVTRRPIPALVPIVPCMWSVMAILEFLLYGPWSETSSKLESAKREVDDYTTEAETRPIVGTLRPDQVGMMRR